MTRLFLVRHAPTAANAGAYFQGQQDTPALPVAGVAPLPPGPRTVYSSPLQRARAAVDVLFPGEAVTFDDRLRERSVGVWEGLHHDEVQARWPGTFLPDGSLDPAAEPPAGETLAEFADRVEGFLAWLDARREGDVFVVTHNGWIRVALWRAGVVAYDDLFGESVPFLTPLELPG